MPEPVKSRTYDSPSRRAAAERTRLAVLRAARELFISQGYAGTSVAAIARRARVSVDTVYSSVGRKPALLLAVHDMALAGTDAPVGAEERDYVQAVRAAPSARAKIETYAAALARVLPTSVPLLLALRAAGANDPDCRALDEQVAQRRADHMRLFAADLRATGQLRDDLSDEQVADLVWSMNGPDYYDLLSRRGHSPEEFAALLVDVWTRTLLAAP